MTSAVPTSTKPPVAQKARAIAAPASDATLVASYWPALDGLRTLAFTLVFCHHMYDVRGLQHPKTLALIASKLVGFGWIGVDLFFVISGFLMTSLLSQEHARFGNVSALKFYGRRALRIWPAYLASMAFLFFAVPHLLNANMNGASWWQFVSTYNPLTLLFIGNFTSMADCAAIFADCQRYGVTLGALLLTPLWSLCIEEQFYLVLPLLLTVFVSPRKCLLLFSLILITSVLLRLQVNLLGSAIPHDAWYRNTPCHLDPMMIGCIIATCNQRFDLFRRVKPFAGVIAGLSVCSLIGFVAILPAISNDPIWSIGLLAIALCFGGLLVSACSSPAITAVLANRVFAAIGKKTYAMYLWHCFVIAQVTVLLAPMFGPAWDTPRAWCIEWVVSLAATFAVAAISWSLVEAPANKLKRHFERH